MKPKRKWAYQSSCDAAVNPTACYRKNARKVCGNGIDLDQNQMHLWQNLPRPRCPRTAHAPGISPIEIAMEPQHLHKLRPDYGAVLLGLDRLPDQIEEKTLTLFDRNQFQATSSVDRTIGSNAITDCTSVNTGPLGFKNISARKVITPRTMADKVERVFGIRWRSHAKNSRNFGCPSDRRERLLRFVMRSLVFGKRNLFAVIRSQFHG